MHEGNRSVGTGRSGTDGNDGRDGKDGSETDGMEKSGAIFAIPSARAGNCSHSEETPGCESRSKVSEAMAKNFFAFSSVAIRTWGKKRMTGGQLP